MCLIPISPFGSYGYHFIESRINFLKHRDEIECGLRDATDYDDVFDDSVKQHRDSIEGANSHRQENINIVPGNNLNCRIAIGL